MQRLLVLLLSLGLVTGQSTGQDYLQRKCNFIKREMQGGHKAWMKHQGWYQKLAKLCNLPMSEEPQHGGSLFPMQPMQRPSFAMGEVPGMRPMQSHPGGLHIEVPSQVSGGLQNAIGWAKEAASSPAGVELLCFPKMEEFMETEPVKAEPVVEPGRKGTRADAAKPSRMEEGSKKRKAEKAEASFAEVKPEKAEPKAEPKKKVKSGAAAFKAKPPKNGGPAQPDFDDPIEFVQTNPKKVGGTAFHRYEKYKAAKTVKEALSLGAAKGDVLYDWAKGFIKRL